MDLVVALLYGALSQDMWFSLSARSTKLVPWLGTALSASGWRRSTH